MRPSDTAADLLREGAALARRGDLTRAAAAFQQAAALVPDAPQAHFNLGNAQAGLGQLDAAAAAFGRALAADPGFVPARNNLGSLRLRQQRPAEALAEFERVVATEPGFPHAHHNLGAALQALDRLDEAAAAYRRALERDPADLGALNDLCIVQMKQGEPAAALELCERYLALSPANRKPLAYKAAALIELGRRDKAALLLDFERLVFRHRIATPDGHASREAFDSALVAHVLGHPTLEYEPRDKATRGGYQSGELMVEPKGAAGALEAAIRDAVPRYMARLREALPDHPFVAHLPQRWRLATWAVVLKAQGQQGPHFHPDGYVSGVYYARLPQAVKNAAGDAGCIEFGRTAEHLGGTGEPMVETIRPEEGLMLLFPSYFYHRTIPFQGGEPRICVAFDVLPVDRA